MAEDYYYDTEREDAPDAGQWADTPSPKPAANQRVSLTPKQWGILAVPLAVAVIAGVALWFTNVQGAPTADDRIIEQFIPAEGTQVLQQSQVGVDLQTGWTATLQVNGVRIPEDQMQKQQQLGRFTFQPGEGKVIESLQAGSNCATVTYWALIAPETRYPKTWCFTAL